MEFWISSAIGGISFGILLFILAAGLSLTLGLLRILNLVHGSFFLLGSYIAITVFSVYGSWLLSVIISSISIGLLGLVLQLGLFQKFAKGELSQVLLTFGFFLIFADLMLTVWGGQPKYIPKPSYLQGVLQFSDISISIYRIMLIAVGTAVAIALYWMQKYTKLGAVIRAGVDDEKMVEAVGINIEVVKYFVFGLGAMLAALGGSIMVAFTGAYPGLDMDVLLLSLIIVVIGGAGSLKGAFIGALIVGLVQNFSVIAFPKFSLAIVYVPMVIILLLKQEGLFGKT